MLKSVKPHFSTGDPERAIWAVLGVGIILTACMIFIWLARRGQ